MALAAHRAMDKHPKTEPSLTEEVETGLSHLTMGSAASMAGLDLRAQPIPLAVDVTPGGRTIDVDSTSFEAGQPIPEVFSGYGSGRSPALRWRDIPEGAASLVVMAEDPDAHADRPFVHWLLYNLPPIVEGLPEGMPTTEWLKAFPDAAQGRSSKGEVGYIGPRPPKNDPPHHYHFEVFALDRMLNLPPGVERDDVVREMEGHVLASGDLIGTYQAPA